MDHRAQHFEDTRPDEELPAVDRKPPPPPKSSRKKERPFMKTMDIEWAIRASRLHLAGSILANILWYHHGLEPTEPIALTGQRLRMWKMNVDTMYKVLALFEQDGLVKVERKPGKCPRVQLIVDTKPLNHRDLVEKYAGK